MGISLKTGIEPRFSLGEVKSAVKLQVLLGKLRNSMEFFPWNSQICLIQFHMVFSSMFSMEKTK